MIRIWRWLLLAACIGMGGCTTIAAHYIEHPGHVRPPPSEIRAFEKVSGYQQHEFHTRNGLRIAYWYSKPHAMKLVNKTRVQHVDGKPTSLSIDYNFSRKRDGQADPSTRGSVVLLHPWGQNAAQMAYWGVYFSNAGYVTAMPALRSQGDSGDAPVGYGPREADDVVQLVHALQHNGELPQPLYLLGVSYGATVALFAAPKLPHVRGVIALEPYVHPVDVIERAPRNSLFTPRWWPHFLSPRVLQRVFSPHVMQKAIARADQQLGIDLATIDPGNALAASHACTLLLRGNYDWVTSEQAVTALASRSSRAQFVSVPGENHITLFFRSQQLFAPILAWMQSIPPNDPVPCPVFRLPPPPANTLAAPDP